MYSFASNDYAKFLTVDANAVKLSKSLTDPQFLKNDDPSLALVNDLVMSGQSREDFDANPSSMDFFYIYLGKKIFESLAFLTSVKTRKAGNNTKNNAERSHARSERKTGGIESLSAKAMHIVLQADSNNVKNNPNNNAKVSQDLQIKKLARHNNNPNLPPLPPIPQIKILQTIIADDNVDMFFRNNPDMLEMCLNGLVRASSCVAQGHRLDEEKGVAGWGKD